MGLVVMSATEDDRLGLAIEFVVVLRSDTLEVCKVCLMPVLHRWRGTSGYYSILSGPLSLHFA